MSLVMFALTVLLFSVTALALAGVWLILSIVSRNEALTDQVCINNQILVNRYNSQVAAYEAAEKAERAREESKRKKTEKDNLFKFNPRKDDDKT